MRVGKFGTNWRYLLYYISPHSALFRLACLSGELNNNIKVVERTQNSNLENKTRFHLKFRSTAILVFLYKTALVYCFQQNSLRKRKIVSSRTWCVWEIRWGTDGRQGKRGNLPTFIQTIPLNL